MAEETADARRLRAASAPVEVVPARRLGRNPVIVLPGRARVEGLVAPPFAA